jgi:hypothetical protein
MTRETTSQMTGSGQKGAVRSRPLMTLRLDTAPIQDVGAGPHGARVTFPIRGGSFEGDRLRGKVLPGGDDWTIRRADGAIELDLRITLETDDGALIHMMFEGIRDDAAAGGPYFRTISRFEASEGKYAFLNRLLAVGSGQVGPGGPLHIIEEVL